jgi:hypothetical protein
MYVSIHIGLLLSGSARARAPSTGALAAEHGVHTAVLVDITTKRESTTGVHARPIAFDASGVCT